MNERRWMMGVLISMCTIACHASEDSSGETASSASAAPSASAAFANQHPRHNRGGGLEGLIFNAAHDLPTLTDEQKTKIDTAEDEVPMPGQDTGPRDAAKAFSTDLAAQIRAGKIDATKLQPDEAAMDAALNGMLEKQAKALSDLHDALDVTQRTTIATNLHTSIAAAPDPSITHDAGAPADRVARQVDRMSTDLTLDDAQKKQITAVLLKDEKAKDAKPPQDKRKDLDVVLSAFQADTFDAKQTLSQAMFGGKAPHEGMDDQIKMTAELVPILHPDQREKLAAAAERPPMPQGMRPGPNMGGGGMRAPGLMRNAGNLSGLPNVGNGGQPQQHP